MELPTRRTEIYMPSLGQLCLNLFPELLGYDSQLRCLASEPFRFGASTLPLRPTPLSGLRSVPHDGASIQFPMQHFPNGSRRPSPTATTRWGHLFGIELLRQPGETNS